MARPNRSSLFFVRLLMLLALGVVVAVVLLSQSEGPRVVYEAF